MFKNTTQESDNAKAFEDLMAEMKDLFTLSIKELEA